MEKKRGGRASSPCERILNAVRTCPVVAAIRRRIPPASQEGARPSPPPPRVIRNVTIAAVESGAEKILPVQSNNDDQVPIIKSAKIAPATEPVPLPDQVSGVEKTKPKVTEQLRGEVPGVTRKKELEPTGAASVSGGKKSDPQVQIREGTNHKGSVAGHIENLCSDFIERARNKLEIGDLSVGGGDKEGKSGKVKGDPAGKTDEHFTNYIKKAREKLRTTSFGGGKAPPST